MEVNRLAGPAIGVLLDLARQHDREELVDAIAGEFRVYGLGIADPPLSVPSVNSGLECLAPEPEEPGPR
jgi:hypothetical protein